MATQSRKSQGSGSSSTSISVESIVRGHHVFKEVWSPRRGDKFYLQVEEFNRCDRYAVAIVVDEETVGHVPREVSKLFYYFLKGNGTICGEVQCILDYLNLDYLNPRLFERSASRNAHAQRRHKSHVLLR